MASSPPLNLPILHLLEGAENILLAGAGGGFDFLAGMPIYHTLRELGKTVHIANYSFTDHLMAKHASLQTEVLIDDYLVGVTGAVKLALPYFPEGYASQWFKEKRDEDVTIWLFERAGMPMVRRCYEELVAKLNIEAIILVDGGVDSLMRGNEFGPGTLLEDSISLGAVNQLDVPVKILASIGFGTEIEERLCHYHALQNMGELAAQGGFLGSCALTPQMPAFQFYEEMGRYIFEQPDHKHSHISTRIIPATHGEFGHTSMYPEDKIPRDLCLSLLMSLYWFFDVGVVCANNPIVDLVQYSFSFEEALLRTQTYMQMTDLRDHKYLPY